MTSITFGGGPDLETRRKFSNLKDGSQVPGYIGYIHQLKYNCGHTYGDQTHKLGSYKWGNTTPLLTRNKTSLGFDDGSSSNVVDGVTYKPLQVRNTLPKSNGINRLTESMVPGYTGYVPSRKFKFSATYKNECDECVDKFLDGQREKREKNESIMNAVRSQPELVPISTGEDLSEKLSVRKSEMFSYLPNDKRKLTEAPMPGYTGHVPKIVPTEMGLGARYHVTTERGFRAFDRDYRRHKSAANFRSLSFEPSVSGGEATTTTSEYIDVESSKRLGGKRVFIKPGMIPQYTGHVHARRFEFGNTYGNTTRELPVCAHDATNFGAYMKSIGGAKTFIC